MPAPMTTNDVRDIIAEMRAATRSKAARIAMAKAALKHDNVTIEGREIWRAYLAAEMEDA